MNNKFVISIVLVLIASLVIELYLVYGNFSLYNKDEEDFAENKEQNYENEEEEQKYFYDTSLIKEKDRQNKLKKNLMKLLESSQNIRTLNEKQILQKIDIWKNHTYPYLGIERFSIPMISTISAGKTSTSNYLLNLKYNIVHRQINIYYLLILNI